MGQRCLPAASVPNSQQALWQDARDQVNFPVGKYTSAMLLYLRSFSCSNHGVFAEYDIDPSVQILLKAFVTTFAATCDDMQENAFCHLISIRVFFKSLFA